MAEFLVTLGEWSADNTSVSAILAGLQELRQKARASARVSIVNLVVVTHDEVEAEKALKTLREMGARHPARTIVCIIEPDAMEKENRVDAKAQLLGSFIAGHPVCTDVIQLKLYGPVVNHIDSIVNPIQILDVPAAVWYYDTDPMGNDSLLEIADTIIVDTKELGAKFALADISDLTVRKHVVDLAWIRLRPWRDLLANLFEGEVLRPFADCVTEVRVYGKSAPRRLLSGWIASRLGLPPEAIVAEDAQHVTIEMKAEFAGNQAEFLVERLHEQRQVHSSVHLNGELFFEENVGLSDNSLADALTIALTQMNSGIVFQEALRTGLDIEDAVA